MSMYIIRLDTSPTERGWRLPGVFTSLGASCKQNMPNAGVPLIEPQHQQLLSNVLALKLNRLKQECDEIPEIAMMQFQSDTLRIRITLCFERDRKTLWEEIENMIFNNFGHEIIDART